MPLLAEFPAGGTLFLDANIFLGHLLRGDVSCGGCFQRLRLGEIHGVTSVAVLTEVRHRALLTEALRQGYLTDADRALRFLRERPDVLPRLHAADASLTALLDIPLKILSVTPTQFRAAQRLSLRHHLLTNDALHLAVMRAHHLRHLATADRDFLHIPRLTVWTP